MRGWFGGIVNGMEANEGTTVSDSLAPADAQRANTCTAVALGWHAAAFYDTLLIQGKAENGEEASASQVDSENGKPPATLPSRKEVRSESDLGTKQIRADIARLMPLIDGVGLDCKALHLTNDFDHLDNEAQIERLLAFNTAVLDTLKAADFRVAKGYSIGQRIAKLNVLMPDDVAASCQDGEVASPFGGLHVSLDSLDEHIKDLRSVLPEHAAKATQDTIEYWHRWLSNPVDAAGKTRSVDDVALHDEVSDAMKKQTKIWRGLLTGERTGPDYLDVGGYISAADTLIATYRAVVTSILKKWWPYILVAGLIVGAIVGLLLGLGNGTAGRISAAATVLAAIGISGRTVSTTLTKVMNSIEGSLAGAELDTAIGVATVRLPFEVRPNSLLAHSPASRQDKTERSAHPT